MSFGKSGPATTRLQSGAKIVTYNLNTAKLHTYVAPEKSFGNATHIIESKNFLVLIDTQYLIPYSKEFKKYAESLGKTIAGIIISHDHPDHFFGLSQFGNIKSYALKEVIEEIKKKGPGMIEESKKKLGDLIPNKVTVPNTVLHPGTTVIDNVKYRYTKYNDAEAETQVVIELPELHVVIVQDLVYNRYHPWLGKNIDNWIKTIDSIKEKNRIVLGGHGMPASSGAYGRMKKYLVDADKIIKTSGGDKNKIFNSLTEKYPNYKGRKIIPMYLEYM